MFASVARLILRSRATGYIGFSVVGNHRMVSFDLHEELTGHLKADRGGIMHDILFM